MQRKRYVTLSIYLSEGEPGGSGKASVWTVSRFPPESPDRFSTTLWQLPPHCYKEHKKHDRRLREEGKTQRKLRTACIQSIRVSGGGAALLILPTYPLVRFRKQKRKVFFRRRQYSSLDGYSATRRHTYAIYLCGDSVFLSRIASDRCNGSKGIFC